tara:strand:- start:164 stop:472 length:309 start_codon:yes stop_codon:yes gene_type:complete
MYWKIFKVSGNSMSPTIVDGDYILARKFKTKPANGSIAVIQHPSLGRLIKRINFANHTGEIFVSGDNDLSTPSEEIGPLNEELFKYHVFYRISPAGLSSFAH